MLLSGWNFKSLIPALSCIFLAIFSCISKPLNNMVLDTVTKRCFLNGVDECYSEHQGTYHQWRGRNEISARVKTKFQKQSLTMMSYSKRTRKNHRFSLIACFFFFL